MYKCMREKSKKRANSRFLMQLQAVGGEILLVGEEPEATLKNGVENTTAVV